MVTSSSEGLQAVCLGALETETEMDWTQHRVVALLAVPTAPLGSARVDRVAWFRTIEAKL